MSFYVWLKRLLPAVRIADFAKQGRGPMHGYMVITDRKIRGRRLKGPAVLFPAKMEISDCNFEGGSAETIFCDFEDRYVPVGAILCMDVLISHCELTNIAVIARSDQISKMRQRVQEYTEPEPEEERTFFLPGLLAGEGA